MAPEGELRPPPAGRSRESRPCAHPPWGREWRASGRAQLGSIQPDLGLGSRCATQAGYSGSLGLISFICKTGPIKCPPECQQPLPGCPPRTWAWERDTGRFHSEAAVVLPRQGPSEAGHLFLAPKLSPEPRDGTKGTLGQAKHCQRGFQVWGRTSGPFDCAGRKAVATRDAMVRSLPDPLPHFLTLWTLPGDHVVGTEMTQWRSAP